MSKAKTKPIATYQILRPCCPSCGSDKHLLETWHEDGSAEVGCRKCGWTWMKRRADRAKATGKESP